MTARAPAYLTQILQSLDRIASYSAEGSRAFFESPLLQDGIVHNLELIGASVKQLPAELLASHPNIPWSAIARMRDRLAHHYLGLDLELVWEVVQHDLPPLKDAVIAMLQTISQEPAVDVSRHASENGPGKGSNA
ncbi:HepT-like ribonuclease domain-containing protein [Sulfobacillus thermosulfidooxidans]|uniref:HepT-like ribonuclease domain-containing protein n=1 Tax=Sulfobacillus thermosulfidooxidans TaxID=28034 RepID=UPI0009E7340A|nr:DUF86 domain-containing protein [Sulfobacillus thermosulfidooxidans]